MITAFLWGALAASTLLIGALVAYVTTPSKSFIAVIMALGAGLLIGSVAFDLIDEALKTADVGKVGLFTLLGAATFTAGNRILDRRGGGDRKDSGGAQASGSALAIVFGSVLDGIPESFVLGLTVLQGGVSVALLIGVLLSNLPEGLSSSSGLRTPAGPSPACRGCGSSSSSYRRSAPPSATCCSTRTADTPAPWFKASPRGRCSQ